MQVVGKCLTLDEFRRYAREFAYGSIPPTSLVIHHTWNPIKSGQPVRAGNTDRGIWKGARSIDGLRTYYEGKGWSAGPHLFIAEDGIWLFTPMSDVGIHSGEGNAKYKWGRLQSYSIGIEVVGDYDAERWSGQTLTNTLGVVKVLMGHLKIPTESVYFHRDFPSAKKSCPGAAITKDWLFAELSKLDSDGEFVGANGEPSAFAKEAWEWQRGLGIDGSILPGQTVTAEAVFTWIKKLKDKGEI